MDRESAWVTSRLVRSEWILSRGKDVTQTIDGKKEQHIDELGMKVGIGGFKFGLSRTTTQVDGKAPQTENIPIFSLERFEGENAQIGVGVGGCVFACGQIEVGIQADQALQDLSDYFNN